MGIELMDALWGYAQQMLGYFTTISGALTSILSYIGVIKTGLTSVNENLGTIDDNIDAVLVYISAEDYSSASALLTTTKGVVGSAQSTLSGIDTTIESNVSTAQTAVSSGVGIVNALTPLITQEVERVWKNDGTKYRYKCKVCSIKCPDTYPFKPLDESVLKICKMTGKSTADFKEVTIDNSE